MMTQMNTNLFEALLIPRRELPQFGARYRVYKDAGNFILVEADSALEALKAYGVGQVHRIERDAIYLNNVLAPQALANVPALSVAEAAPLPPAAEPPAAAPPAAEIAAIASAEPAAATPPAAADAPLSPEDVNKLLNNPSAA